MTQDIAPLLAALTDPTRRAILDRLAEGEATVGELAEALSAPQPAISRHLKVLTEAGLTHRRVDAQRRPARLAPEGFAPLDDWTRTLRETYETRYAQLDRLLADMPDEET